MAMVKVKTPRAAHLSRRGECVINGSCTVCVCETQTETVRPRLSFLIWRLSRKQ